MRYSFDDIEVLESQIFGQEDSQNPDLAEQERSLAAEGEAGLPEGMPQSPEDGELVWQEGVSDTDSTQPQPPVMMDIVMEDGTQMECRVEGVFLEGDKEYIALETGQGEIQIMELGQGEDDEIQLIPVTDEEEQQRAVEAFIALFGESADEAPSQAEETAGVEAPENAAGDTGYVPEAGEPENVAGDIGYVLEPEGAEALEGAAGDAGYTLETEKIEETERGNRDD